MMAARSSVLLLALLAGAWLAPAARADEQAGLILARRARAALTAGDPEQALELLAQARVEWPGSPLIANTLADAQRELGRYNEALAEYERGMREGYEHHARFNRAVTRHAMAQGTLEQAGVPLEVTGLPEGPQPEMLTAVEQALPELSAARDDFLASLDHSPEPAARESVGALNRRIDRLNEIAEELRRRQEEQEQDEQQDERDEPEDEPEDQGQQDQDQQDQDASPDEEQPSEDPAQDQPQDQDAPQDEPQPTPAQPQELSAEQVQQLLDRLESLEKEARALQKLREEARRQPVEKDW
jgi:Ca-activated chloride channel family protein